MSSITNVANATLFNVVPDSNTIVGSLLNAAVAKHNAWYTGNRAASLQELYSVLSACLILMEKVSKERLYATLDSELAALGFKSHAKTSLQMRIVRAVFKHDVRDLSRYAAVIKLASVNHIKSEDFIGWIVGLGGIDAVRRHYAKPKPVKVSNDVLYSTATGHLHATPALATIGSKLLGNVSTTPASGYIVSIARINTAGDFEVVGASSDTTAVRMAMVSWGQHVIDKNLSMTVDNDAKASNLKLAAALAE